MRPKMGDRVPMLLREFWDNFSMPPSKHEQEALNNWATDFDDDNLLAKVLEIDRHPKQLNGAIAKASLATLKTIASDLIQVTGKESADNKRSCFYCNHGFVYIVDPRDFELAVIGVCKECTTEGFGSAGYRRVSPPLEIIRKAREADISCFDATEKVVEQHNMFD